MSNGAYERARIRLINDPQFDEKGETEQRILLDLVHTVSDRVCLRVRCDLLPAILESIVVDASVKAWRRQYYEGISTEGADTISTSFVDDILSEYDDELEAYRNRVDDTNDDGTSKRLVSFI